MKRAGALALALAAVPAGAAQNLGEVQPVRDGAQVYSATCAYCHGTNVGPVIRGRALPAAYVAMMVRNGRGAMPAFRPSEITPAELAAVARWIETSRGDAAEKGH